MSKAISKREMQAIFKKHGLIGLGFPTNSKNGNDITDWYLLYHNTQDNSDLQKFKDIIKEEYPQYELGLSTMLATISVKRSKSE